jgi:hypothetical protein
VARLVDASDKVSIYIIIRVLALYLQVATGPEKAPNVQKSAVTDGVSSSSQFPYKNMYAICSWDPILESYVP